MSATEDVLIIRRRSVARPGEDLPPVREGYRSIIPSITNQTGCGTSEAKELQIGGVSCHQDPCDAESVSGNHFLIPNDTF